MEGGRGGRGRKEEGGKRRLIHKAGCQSQQASRTEKAKRVIDIIGDFSVLQVLMNPEHRLV